MNYWAERQARAQSKLTDININRVNKQLENYYLKTMKQVIRDYETTYDGILAQINKGAEPSPALLYKQDTYWKLQGELRAKLLELGNKQATLLSKEFEKQYFSAYNALSLPSQKAFAMLDKSMVKQMINQIWCADGKNWSSRVWDNIGILQTTLNDNLIQCVSAGRSTKDLKKMLQNRFGVSYSRANTIVRTEMAHLQTMASKDRYQSYGLQYYEILGNEENSCESEPNCSEMDGKRFLLNEMVVGVNAPPFHPNCRCCIIPVVD